MNQDKAVRDFILLFSELSESNQKNMIAVEHALIFAQTMAEQGPVEHPMGPPMEDECLAEK